MQRKPWALCFTAMLAFACGCAAMTEKTARGSAKDQPQPRDAAPGTTAPPAGSPLARANYEWPAIGLIKQKRISVAAPYQAEIDRTWYWLAKIMRQLYLPEQLKRELILMPGMNARRRLDHAALRMQRNEIADHRRKNFNHCG